ncbi:DUF975 family protein [Candidatus Xianfuyuplasma coldseepsis]|uniref:DUF975 family protein n=1 Tax=Candidatus Xianfuyuplasma coldseepsis TaxID=2782163 RepID=A0A7L7KVS3_9MOLU|nr:DUF975 family protein [Xianfuyuplasma coldseepsis]QMS85848.1 DUF975 family protein [Xianfuyuplasma coldseepsis]
MTFRELKTRARQHLQGNWGIAIIAMILFSAINGLPNSLVQAARLGVDNLAFLLPVSQIVGIISILLIPLVVGYNRIHLDLAEGTPTNLDQMFYPFRRGQYGRSLLTMFLVQLFTGLWTLLFIIPGIIKAFSYAMTSYILADPMYDSLEGTEPITESRELMDGHKMEYFLLILSIIWWIIPFVIMLPIVAVVIEAWTIFSLLLGGIAVVIIFILGPYIQQVTAEFYLDLTGPGKPSTSAESSPPVMKNDPLDVTDDEEEDDPFADYYN